MGEIITGISDETLAALAEQGGADPVIDEILFEQSDASKVPEELLQNDVVAG